MTPKQKLKELLKRIKKWKENKDDQELDDIINEYEASEDDAEDEDPGSNPPGQPTTPP